MLNLPTDFGYNRLKSGAPSICIIKLTDGTTTWYLGNNDMFITEGQVFNVLTKLPTWSQKINPLESTFTRTPCNITFSNSKQYKVNDSGEWVRLSDELTSGIVGRDVSIYYSNNPAANQLSDMLNVYNGIVEGFNGYDSKELKITLNDKAGILDRKVLTISIHDTPPAYEPPEDNKYKLLPVAYGRFQRGKTVGDPSHGCAKAINVGINLTYEDETGPNAYRKKTYYTVAGHPTVKIRGVYIATSGEDSLPGEIPPYDPVSDTNGFLAFNTWGGITVEPRHSVVKLVPGEHDINPSYQEVFTLNSDKRWPFNQTTGGNDDRSWFDGIMAEAAHDGLIYGGIAAVCGWIPQQIAYPYYYQAYHRAYIVWEINDAARFKTIFENTERNPKLYVRYKWFGHLLGINGIDPYPPTDMSRLQRSFRLIHSDHNNRHDAHNAWTSLPGSIVYQPYNNDVHKERIMGGLTIEDVNNHGGFTRSSGPVSEPGGGEYALALVTDYKSTGIPMYHASLGEAELIIADQAMDEPKMYVWVDCDGRRYPTELQALPFINFNSGDYIADGSMMIADMLRVAADYDVETDINYIRCFIPSFPMRLNVTDKDTSLKEAIKQLAEQSLIVPFFSAYGKFSIGIIRPLNTESWYSNLTTIHRADIVGDIKIDHTDPHDIINVLNIEYNWRGEENKFAEKVTYENSTSIDTYGRREYDLQWKNIDHELGGVTMANPVWIISNHLIDHKNNGTTGLWSDVHTRIKFKTAGWRCAHYELWDGFELDEVSCDPWMKCFGETWAGKRFTITSIKHTTDGAVEIEAMQLFDLPPLNTMV